MEADTPTTDLNSAQGRGAFTSTRREDSHIPLEARPLVPEAARVGRDPRIAKMHPERAIPTAVVIKEYEEAKRKAWDNLARYKFSNFGYWSSRVVFLGQLLERLGVKREPNPFRELVQLARGRPHA